MSDTQTTSSETEQTATPERVGDTLRQARERAGLNIADVARALRISQKYLEALEDNRHEDLPGTTYAIGFVRSFAEHLHLDGEEMVRRYKDEAAGVSNPNDLSFPKPISEGGVPTGAVLGLGVIVAAIAYGAWYWNSTQEDVTVARVEAVPEELAVEKTEEPAVETITESVEPPVEDAEEVVEEAKEAVEETAEAVKEVVVEVEDKVEETASEVVEEKVEEVTEAARQMQEPVAENAEEVVQDTTEKVEEVAQEAEAASEAETVEPGPVAEKVEPAAEPVSVTPVERENVGPSRITLRGKSNSWISVRDTVSDRLLFMRLLSKGEEYQVPNRTGLELMTGNAGELELWIDGKLIAPLGRIGEVKRNVVLDADKLKASVQAEQ